MVKVRGKLKPWCKYCYTKKKKGRLYNFCKIDPRHKHRTKFFSVAVKTGEIDFEKFLDKNMDFQNFFSRNYDTKVNVGNIYEQKFENSEFD